MGGIQIPFIDSESTENESSSLELELIVDKEKEEKKPTEIGQSFNAYSYDPSVLKDKPWLKPGSDITDYFNYGFTEKTWMKYCEMQRENREWGGRQNKLERETNDRGYERRYRASDNEGRERRRVGNEGQHWRGHEDGRRLPSEDSYGRTYNDGRQYYNNDDRKYYRNDDRRSYNDSYDRRSYNDSYDRKYSNDFYDRKTYKDSYDDKYSKRSRKN